MILSGESVSADLETPQNFPAELAKIIKEGGYYQVFNANEMKLFCKNRFLTETCHTKNVHYRTPRQQKMVFSHMCQHIRYLT